MGTRDLVIILDKDLEAKKTQPFPKKASKNSFSHVGRLAPKEAMNVWPSSSASKTAYRPHKNMSMSQRSNEVKTSFANLPKWIRHSLKHM